MSHSPTSFADLSSLNKAAGEPLRLEILRVLAQDSYGVLELCDIFQHKQSGMSHHLKVLAEADLVAKRREGNSIFYSRALPKRTLTGFYQELLAAIDLIAISKDVAERLQAVKDDRARQSRKFFTEQAGKFKQQQDLIAEFPVYGDAVMEMLNQAEFPEFDLSVEVGPGAGELVPLIAQKFNQVIALDNAKVMLEKTKLHCEKEKVSNTEFIFGDTKELVRLNSRVDCVVMNMVLHHTPSPADIFLDIAPCLKNKGVLIVTDLCRHNQDWAKESCGDIWLGFDPEELTRWAELAELSRGHSNYLALRNGFQIQVQQFIKKN